MHTFPPNPRAVPLIAGRIHHGVAVTATNTHAAEQTAHWGDRGLARLCRDLAAAPRGGHRDPDVERELAALREAIHASRGAA